MAQENASVSGTFEYVPGTTLTLTLWDQSGTIYIPVDGEQVALTGYEYNKFCPDTKKDSKEKSVTGCTNTAHSQIIYYWMQRGYEFNLSVNSSDYYTLASEELKEGQEPTKYYVSNAPTLGEGAMSTINSILRQGDLESGDFIAALNYYCGVKNNSEYGTSTGTTWNYFGASADGTYAAAFKAAGFDSYYSITSPQAMEHFEFEPDEVSKVFFDDNGLSEVGWSIIRENIDYGEVVDVTIPGHSVYIDGYRFNEASQSYEYHVNYGWGTEVEQYTKWYGADELGIVVEDGLFYENSIIGITIDLSPDIKVVVSNDRGDYYGGSFIRGLERINNIQKDKSTTFTFANELDGKTITLSSTAEITSEVDVEFRNFNVNLYTNKNTLFVSDDAMSFEMFDGSIVVNSSSASAAVYEKSGEKLTLNMNSSWIYSGYMRNGQEILLNSLDLDNGYNTSVIADNILDSVRGYAVRSGNGSDTITLTNNSAIFGTVDLGGGRNTITIENGSLIYGGFAAGTKGTLTVNMIINSGSNGAMIVADDSESFSNLYRLVNGKINVEICAGVQATDYILIDGYSATDITNMTVDLLVDGKTYTLDYDNRTAGDYTLVFNGGDLLLRSNKSIQSVEPVRIFQGGNVIAGGKMMENQTIGGNQSMHVSRNGVVKETVVNSNGAVSVLSGGIAQNTSIAAGGNMYADKDAVIRGLDLAAGAIFNGFVNSETASSFDDKIAFEKVSVAGGIAYLLDGQSAEEITNVNKTVVIEGSAYNIANSAGHVVINSGGRVASIDAEDGAVNIYDGGSLAGMIAEGSNTLTVCSGGSAANILLEGDYYLEEGAVLTGTHEFNGKMYVSGKVNARSAYIIIDMQGAEVTDTAIISNLDNLNAWMYTITVDGELDCGTYILADNAANFSGGVAMEDVNGKELGGLSLGGGVVVYSGNTYTLERIDNSLCLTVGLVAAPPLKGDMVTVFKDGKAVKSAAVLTGEKIGTFGGNNLMHVSSGGFVNLTTLNISGRIEIHSGGSALATTIGAGSATVLSGGVMNDTVVGQNGSMCVIGGQANDIELCELAAYLAVNSSGTATDVKATGNFTKVDVSDYGVVSNLQLTSSAACAVSNGELLGAEVGSDAKVYVGGGAYVENLKIDAGGSAMISAGAAVYNINVANGGIMDVTVDKSTVVTGSNQFGAVNIKNGVATGGKYTNGTMTILKGTAYKVAVDSNALMLLQSGAVAQGVHIGNGGTVRVFKGATASNTTVWSGSELELRSGAVHDGELKIYKGGSVDVEKGGKINLSLVGRNYADDSIISDISAVKGAPTYTITVLATQSSGSYVLAEGAEDFTGTFTIGNGKKNYGKLSVNGKSVTYNGVRYTLVEQDGDLTINISGKTPTLSSDLDANGLSDVILRHKAGFAGVWQTTGGSDVIAWSDLDKLGKDTVLLGAGKLNGTADGQDIFFVENRTVKAWNIADGKITGTETVWKIDSDKMNVLGLGDFNGDGKTDLLLRSNGGTIGCWMTDGSNWNEFQSVGKEWKVAAVGDFDNDGIDDIVLEHSSGFAGIWLTQEDGTVKWSNLDTLKDGCQIIGAGDFNGDGTDDVLLRKGSWVGSWLIEEGEVDGFMGICSNRSEVEQIGDFDGDGIDDLRIRNEAGDIGVLYVRGADKTEWEYFQSVGSEWDTKYSVLA